MAEKFYTNVKEYGEVVEAAQGFNPLTTDQYGREILHTAYHEEDIYYLVADKDVEGLNGVESGSPGRKDSSSIGLPGNTKKIKLEMELYE